ncbi:polysaccharide deacetylase family protein [Clostridium estertheticum]|uniref:polysaccharide deacetylase family protein n=1 Tax=Clostridium estertheticum TaxID=238834 RepID=UPI001C6F4C9D|nr:polysaccharide deacetylase family protein [Clostridium estertheticum]MBW9154559.1 polysaccharide deacetylase [Clostridium estertheticum]WLC83572.1 polysaccharide deacetylase [Clostridium estertheticum]
MKKKKIINKRPLKISLICSCIFLIIIGTIIIGKSFTKDEVNAEPVIVPITTVTATAKATNTLNNNSNESTKHFAVNKEGEKYIYDAAKVSAILNYKGKNDNQKIAFLTFDDGPSTTVTPKVLDILKENNVKATFFLVGQNIESNEKSKELVKREFNEGHAIGNHTYNHNEHNSLFPNNKINVPIFMKDVKKNDDALKNILGQDFSTRILRVPGGYMSRAYYRDPNLPEFDAKLKEKNIISIDWNAEIKDAEGKPNKTPHELLNVLKEEVGTQEKLVILMHDTYGKMQTANALPQIIEYLKDKGYEFRTIK